MATAAPTLLPCLAALATTAPAAPSVSVVVRPPTEYPCLSEPSEPPEPPPLPIGEPPGVKVARLDVEAQRIEAKLEAIGERAARVERLDARACRATADRDWVDAAGVSVAVANKAVGDAESAHAERKADARAAEVALDEVKKKERMARLASARAAQHVRDAAQRRTREAAAMVKGAAVPGGADDATRARDDAEDRADRDAAAAAAAVAEAATRTSTHGDVAHAAADVAAAGAIEVARLRRRMAMAVCAETTAVEYRDAHEREDRDLDEFVHSALSEMRSSGDQLAALIKEGVGDGDDRPPWVDRVSTRFARTSEAVERAATDATGDTEGGATRPSTARFALCVHDADAHAAHRALVYTVNAANASGLSGDWVVAIQSRGYGDTPERVVEVVAAERERVEHATRALLPPTHSPLTVSSMAMAASDDRTIHLITVVSDTTDAADAVVDHLIATPASEWSAMAGLDVTAVYRDPLDAEKK